MKKGKGGVKYDAEGKGGVRCEEKNFRINSSLIRYYNTP